MSYNSPLASPGQYVTKINNLSNEAITIDKGVGNAKRDAADFASKYAGDFSLATDLKSKIEEFSDTWVRSLGQTRDAASSCSGWLDRVNNVFLSLINDIASDGDAKDVITEFNSLNREERPTDKWDLTGAPGVKTTWNELEDLVREESNYVIQTLQSHEWKAAVAELKKQVPGVQSGINEIRHALNSYATKLE